MLICYDLETTSARPDTCRVVQVAAFTVDDKGLPVALINTITNPEVDSCDEATAIHHIGHADWSDKPTDKAVLSKLYYWLDRHPEAVIAGHNITTFDLPILWRLANSPKLPTKVIDTLTCALRCYPHAPCHRLTTRPDERNMPGLITTLGLGSEEGAHTAEGDALMVLRLVNHFCAGLSKTPEELADWCEKPQILNICHFGKHKGKAWGKGKEMVPTGYAYFIAQNFDPTPDLEATIGYHYGFKFRKTRR